VICLVRTIVALTVLADLFESNDIVALTVLADLFESNDIVALTVLALSAGVKVLVMLASAGRVAPPLPAHSPRPSLCRY
jgi:hypothetical protein